MSLSGAARPRVCLVLSGGGARGAAHVGVLKVLEDLHVPVDCIVGTSMGSIVGAAYASGATVQEMEEVLSRLSTRLLFKEQPPREERAVRLKRDDAKNLAPAEVGLGSSGLLLPKGLVSGVQLEAVLRQLSKVRGFRQFDQLPIPFRAVATDLVSGKAVVLKDGELAAAMRASMSVPGAIEPVRIADRLLVDGGLTDNLPVDVARAMGAEVVIAVNLGTPLLRADQLNSILGVTAQMVNILTEQNVQASLASLKPTDILVVPHLDDFSATDFDHLTDVVPSGEAATRAVADLLAPYALSPDAYARWNQKRQSAPPLEAFVPDEIRLNPLQWVDPQIARAEMQTREGQPVDQKVLDRDMQRLFGTGDFEHVSYSLLEEPGKRVLAVDAVEKSWGPNYLRGGLGLSSDFQGDAFFNLLVNYRMTWLNSLGAEWRIDGQLGRTSRVATELYQPLQRGPGFFLAPRALVQRRSVDVFKGDQRIAIFDGTDATVELAAGAQLTHYGETRLGLEYTRHRSTVDTGPPVLDTSRADVNSSAVTLRALVDQLDNLHFPRKGYGATVDIVAAQKSLGGDVNFTRLDLSGTYVHSFGDNTFQVSGKLGRRLGSDALPPSQMFQWGGLLQMSGLPTGALIGEDLRFARLVYYNRLKNWSLLDGIYAGGSLEIGRMSHSLLPGNDLGTIRSASLLLGVDTPLGPLYLGYGHASKGYDSFYVFLGRP
ncbi:patatin-like phospholipase family protein [Ramlibacter ginsenosidimutans]|uniref:Patatin-like phospholipase family protein n=1 Tax=Ramlibacter ginsenosidimutans TaxID=502333 RepID=A0A934TXJ2_9BURK|nr:patatin-like phospholipase family protein [Ramlibacter ginsenosidimutans]MBK6009300.1 patatin-like phospholipase family protein [Ramlibacter ginsenosidimutans]